MTKSPLLASEEFPLYLQVANKLKSWINDGTYLPGSKIPSVRSLSDKLQVSISTVLQSYDVLESQGVIEAKPQSGYYVKSKAMEHSIVTEIKSKPNSTPRLIPSRNYSINIVRTCSNPNLVPLGGAIIHPSLLPTESLLKSLGKVARNGIESMSGYERLAGNWELCKEIARRSIEMGCEVNPNSVFITNGCMEAINIALKAVTRPGDVVAVESPTFYGILHCLESLGLKILELPTSSEEGIDLEAFHESLKKYPVKAAIITPSFLNPLGSLMSDENKEKLVQLCSKFNVSLIEDDIYAELYFEGSRPLSLKSFDKKDEVIYCSSFSKTLSPGFRVGWMIPPEKLNERIELLKSSTSLSTNTAAQMAIVDHLQGHNYERHLRKLRQTLAQNIHMFTMRILHNFPEGTKITQPKGGCLLWVEFPHGVNSIKLHEECMKRKIAIIPGTAFSASGKYLNCIRINCGTPWNPTIEKALVKIGSMAKEMLKKAQ